ncbi:MAG: archease [Planctomycetota bacterium]
MAVRSETFDHDADVGVAGEGDTVEEAFAGAARAMFSVIADLDVVEPRQEVRFACDAPDLELLLVRWLNVLLAEADLRGMVFCDFELEIDGASLRGRALGERLDPARHAPGVEVKGATLTALEVEHGPAGWRAQTVVDV